MEVANAAAAKAMIAEVAFPVTRLKFEIQCDRPLPGAGHDRSHIESRWIRRQMSEDDVYGFENECKN